MDGTHYQSAKDLANSRLDDGVLANVLPRLSTICGLDLQVLEQAGDLAGKIVEMGLVQGGLDGAGWFDFARAV